MLCENPPPPLRGSPSRALPPPLGPPAPADRLSAPWDSGRLRIKEAAGPYEAERESSMPLACCLPKNAGTWGLQHFPARQRGRGLGEAGPSAGRAAAASVLGDRGVSLLEKGRPSAGTEVRRGGLTLRADLDVWGPEAPKPGDLGWDILAGQACNCVLLRRCWMASDRRQAFLSPLLPLGRLHAFRQGAEGSPGGGSRVLRLWPPGCQEEACSALSSPPGPAPSRWLGIPVSCPHPEEISLGPQKSPLNGESQTQALQFLASFPAEVA